MANTNLKKAKAAKNDEFYTQYTDIQNEINAYIDYNPDVFRDKTILLPCDDPEWSNFTKFFINNFERYGIKKLISTSYAYNSKKVDFDYQPTLFETIDPRFEVNRSKSKGKIFTLTKDENKDGKIDEKDLKWDYLEGDGDFRSNEIKKLRDEADIIITNPPFSIFLEFLNWIFSANKKFIVICNKNALGSKEVFPFVMQNKLWVGKTPMSVDLLFTVPNEKTLLESKSLGSGYRVINGKVFARSQSIWITNIEHGKRHQPLKLMTMEDNIKFSKHKQIKGIGYTKYDNYDAIEVPFTDSIPSNYQGVMGVPISFLDKYNPDQFEIIGSSQRSCHDNFPDLKKYDDYWEVKQSGEKTGSSGKKTNENPNIERNDGKNNYFINKDGHIVQSLYTRVFIRHK